MAQDTPVIDVVPARGVEIVCYDNTECSAMIASFCSLSGTGIVTRSLIGGVGEQEAESKFSAEW